MFSGTWPGKLASGEGLTVTHGDLTLVCSGGNSESRWWGRMPLWRVLSLDSEGHFRASVLVAELKDVSMDPSACLLEMKVK